MKDISIIERAREAIKNFPKKLTKTCEEIIELVNRGDEMMKYNEECEQSNEELKTEYLKHEETINKASKIAGSLRDVAREIYEPRIEKAGKIDKTLSGFSKFSKVFELQTEYLKIEEQVEGLIDVSEHLKSFLHWTCYKRGYDYKNEREIEKKLLTRLKQLEQKTDNK